MPHGQWVFSIPKRLRIYFLFDRKLLAKLSICTWKVIKTYLKSSVPENSAVSGASIAVKTYGDFLNFNPHLHAIVSDGCFSKDGDFHMAGRYEQTVRYYGYYSNKSRGMRKKAEVDDDIPSVIPNEMSSKESRQNWARLIQKIYEVDPLICPKCWGQMHIISFIEELDIIEKILRHLGLWDIRNHDPPQPVTSDSIPDLVYDFSDSQIPAADYWN